MYDDQCTVHMPEVQRGLQNLDPHNKSCLLDRRSWIRDAGQLYGVAVLLVGRTKPLIDFNKVP